MLRATTNGVHCFDISTWCVLYILIWKRASRHNGMHFFDISTSKSGPNMVCFVHFDLEMCFAHLRATTACTFSTSQLPKVVRTWCALYILTWKCASRIFAPQRRALFRHLNFQKWSDHGVFNNVHFDLEMCFAHLRATMACNLSALI